MIGAYLIDNITLKQYKGEDKYGTPDTVTEVVVPARIDYKNRQITNLEGETIVSMAKILIQNRTIRRRNFEIRDTTDIAYEDLVMFDEIDHAIIRIGRQKDFRTRFMEVWVA